MASKPQRLKSGLGAGGSLAPRQTNHRWHPEKGPEVGGGSSLVVVGDAVGPVGLVHDEGGALQGAGADHTGEALRVVGLARGSQHAVSDRLPTGVALLQGVLRRRGGRVVAAGGWQGTGTRGPAVCPAPALTPRPGTHGVAALAVRSPLQAVELLALELLFTLAAGEAGDVEELPQSANRGL